MAIHLFGRPLTRHSTRIGTIAILAAALLLQTVYLPRTTQAAAGPVVLAAGETTLLDLMNAERTAAGLAPLQLVSELRTIARGRSLDMVTNDYFSHTIPSCGCNVYGQYTAAGLSWTRGGENLAWNSGYSEAESPQRIHSAWMNSAGHRANILNPEFTHVGIGGIGADGVTWSGKQTNIRMYTQLFATLNSASPTPPPSSSINDPSHQRYAGADRYATAAAISAAGFAPGVPVAYVATGRNFPDALAGSAVAARDGGPVLLTEPGSLPAATAGELSRLRPGRIVILGSTGVVSEAVANQLRAYTASVTRLAGADRYATAAAISAASYQPGAATVYVATGANFPDALAGAVPAGRAGVPILLVKLDSIPPPIAAELSRLRPGRIIILGSSGVVSEAVANQLRAYTASVTRLAGADRYATAAAISRASFAAGGTVYIATGRNFPDALAGAAVAARNGGPILLVNGGTLSADARAELARLHPARVVYLGGPSVVPDSLRNAVNSAW